MVPDMKKLRADYGSGILKVTISSYSKSNNSSHLHITSLIEQAQQMRQVFRSTMVIVLSNEANFLDEFCILSLKQRLLVWSTRLMVVTNLSLSNSRFLHHTLSMTNSMLLLLRYTPDLSRVASITRCDIYVYEPYSQPDAALPITVASWTPQVFKKRHPLFPEKFITLSTGPRLKVSRQPLPNLKTKVVNDPKAPGGKRVVTLSGDVSLITSVSEAMNFTYDFIVPPDGTWGMKLKNGSWTGMMGMTAREEVDIGFGPFGINLARSRAIDFTVPYTTFYGRMMAARRNPEVDPWGFLLPLGPVVWLALLTSLFGVLAVLKFLSYTNKTSSKVTSYSTIRVLFQQDLYGGVFDWFWWERVVVGVWMLAMLVLTRSYAGNLMSILAVRYIPMPIQTLKDLVHNPVTFLVMEATIKAQAFMEAKSGILHEVGSLRHEGRLQTFKANDLRKTMDTLVRKGGYVQMNVDQAVKWVISEDFSRTGRCNFYMGKEEILPLMFAMGGPKGSPLIPAMNQRIMGIIEGGLYNYWFRLYYPNVTYCLNPPNKLIVKTPLGIPNIWGMLVILIGGVVISCLVLLLEIIYSYLCH